MKVKDAIVRLQQMDPEATLIGEVVPSRALGVPDLEVEPVAVMQAVSLMAYGDGTFDVAANGQARQEPENCEPPTSQPGVRLTFANTVEGAIEAAQEQRVRERRQAADSSDILDGVEV